VSEFVDECRREWRRLGVPDPIANEMAADLTADIEEAEAEGGSAEDVLGNSVFEPQRFAASWAGARGVIAAVPPDLSGNSRGRRVVLPVVLTASAVFLALVAFALLIGHRSASAAISVRRIPGGPVSVRPFGRGSVGPPSRMFVFGTQFAGSQNWPLFLVAGFLILAGLVALGVAILYWSPWSRRGPQALARVPGRTKWWKWPDR
jgi:hypothetical protein